MKVANSLNNRCGIFLFYDKDGIVDEYILYMLRDLKKSLSHLLVVCNGAPQAEAVNQLKALADEVIIRENQGFDVGGYRDGIFHVGLEVLAKYEEVVLFNYTFFGSIYPFGEMFEKMSDRDLDFWGITKHHIVDYDPFQAIRYGYIPEHIQSHFLVLRRSLVESEDYKDFIINLKNPTSYKESICEYEAIFTKYFADLGYQWDVYVDSGRYEGYAYNPVMFRGASLIEQNRCPILKRRSCFTDYSDFLINTCGESSIEAYEYIKNHTDYDTNMIWDNILRLENMPEVQRVMQLNYCLPDDVSFKEDTLDDVRIALWVKDTKNLVHYESFFERWTKNYQVHLYGEPEALKEVKPLLEDRVSLYLHEASITGLEDLVRNVRNETDMGIKYHVFGVIDTVEKFIPCSNHMSNLYKDLNCTLATEEFLKNAKCTMEENERLGLAIPPTPDFGDYYIWYADNWKGRMEEVKAYLATAGMSVNMKQEAVTLWPSTGSFWLRSEVLQGRCMEAALKVEAEDEIFLYALSGIAQSERYYTGVFYSDAYAEIEMTNSDYMLRGMNKAVFDAFGPNTFEVVLDRMKNNDRLQSALMETTKSKVKKILRKLLPQKLYNKAKGLYFEIRNKK